MADDHNPYKELLNVIISEGQYNEGGNHLPFSRFFTNYSKQQRDAGGVLNHFTDYLALESIIKGRQIGLRRFDMMYSPKDEGRHIFAMYSDIIDEIHREGKIDDNKKGRLLSLISSNNGPYVLHPDRYSRKYQICTPYVLCFSHNSFVENESDYLSNKDLYIEFYKGNMLFKPYIPILNYHSNNEFPN